MVSEDSAGGISASIVGSNARPVVVSDEEFTTSAAPLLLVEGVMLFPILDGCAFRKILLAGVAIDNLLLSRLDLKTGSPTYPTLWSPMRDEGGSNDAGIAK